MKTPATESTGFAHSFWLAYSEKHNRKDTGILERFRAWWRGL